MKRSAICLAALAALVLSPSAAYAHVIDELDAVLVSAFSGESVPISQALTGWKQGFDDTAAGRAEAGVDFRLAQRLNDGTTAHETGIFRYTFTPEGGETTVAPVHFEALLVKKDGEWLMLMEYQKETATDEEWEAVARS